MRSKLPVGPDLRLAFGQMLGIRKARAVLWVDVKPSVLDGFAPRLDHLETKSLLVKRQSKVYVITPPDFFPCATSNKIAKHLLLFQDACELLTNVEMAAIVLPSTSASLLADYSKVS